MSFKIFLCNVPKFIIRKINNSNNFVFKNVVQKRFFHNSLVLNHGEYEWQDPKSEDEM